MLVGCVLVERHAIAALALGEHPEVVVQVGGEPGRESREAARRGAKRENTGGAGVSSTSAIASSAFVRDGGSPSGRGCFLMCAQRLRDVMQGEFLSRGWPIRPIGFVRSGFPFRKGTPRQGLLAPSTVSVLELDPSVPASAFEGLEEHSHIWLVFMFHENTNAASVMSSSEGALLRGLAAKISPPGLFGKKCVREEVD